MLFKKKKKNFVFTLFCFAVLYWFCHALAWVRRGCAWVPGPGPPSHLPPHDISLDHPHLKKKEKNVPKIQWGRTFYSSVVIIGRSAIPWFQIYPVIEPSKGCLLEKRSLPTGIPYEFPQPVRLWRSQAEFSPLVPTASVYWVPLPSCASAWQLHVPYPFDRWEKWTSPQGQHPRWAQYPHSPCTTGWNLCYNISQY